MASDKPQAVASNALLNALIIIEKIAHDVPELSASFTQEQARACDNALTEIMQAADSAIRTFNHKGLRCAGLDAHKQDPVVGLPDSERSEK